MREFLNFVKRRRYRFTFYKEYAIIGRGYSSDSQKRRDRVQQTFRKEPIPPWQND